MTKLPLPPKEIPRISSLNTLKPEFRVKVEAILVDMKCAGYAPLVFETRRTDERQRYLYGFGRQYDDGRGKVTNVKTAQGGCHFPDMAADIVENDATPWDAAPGFWEALGAAARKHGCVWGGNWKKPDRPHVQAKECPK